MNEDSNDLNSPIITATLLGYFFTASRDDKQTPDEQEKPLLPHPYNDRLRVLAGR